MTQTDLLCGQIEAETDLLPGIIAGKIAGEPADLGAMPYEQIEPLAAYLEHRAEQVYSGNKTFRARLNVRGNAGRDYLYMFMRHWAAAWIQKNLGMTAYRALPDGFNLGRDPHGAR
jgi:hypothetical protein